MPSNGELFVPFPYLRPVSMGCLTVAAAVFSVLAFSSTASAYESASGPRVRGLGVVSAPVDRRGPTMRPDPMITPDSAWMGSGTAGATGWGRAGLTPIVPAAPQPTFTVVPTLPVAATGTAKAKKSGKSRGRIILQKPNG